MLRLKLLVVAGCSCSFCSEILGGFDQNGSRRQLLSMCSDCWNRQTVSCSPVKRQHVSRWFTFADFQGSCLICALRNVARGVTHAKIAVQQAIVPRHGIVHRMNAKAQCSILMEKCPKSCPLSVSVNLLGTLYE